ncbi:MAG: hypothetical protein J7K68_00005, partial [Candidatus Diapherotrites archaeon]|nr:hypothetical protein [Candidatus Diapherotrites archaeon]
EKANEIAEDILKRLRIPRGIPRIEKIITTMEEMLREGQLWNGRIPHKTICSKYGFSDTVLLDALAQASPEHMQKLDEIYLKKEEAKRSGVLERDIDPIARKIAHKHGLHVASEDEFDELFTKAHKELTEIHANEKNLTYEEASKKAAEAIRRILNIDNRFFSWTKITNATRDELHRYCDMFGLQYSKNETTHSTRIKLFKHFRMENRLEEKAKKLVAAYDALKKPYREPTIDELVEATKPTNMSEFYLLREYAKKELKKEIKITLKHQAKSLDVVYELVKEKGGFQPSIKEVIERTGLKECAAHKCITTVMKAIGKKEEKPLVTIRKAKIKEDPYRKVARDQLYMFIPTDYKYFIMRFIDEGIHSRSLLEHEILKVGGSPYISQRISSILNDLEEKGIIRSSGRTYELTELGKKILDATNNHFYEGVLPIELKTDGLECLSHTFGRGLAKSSCRTFLELADLHESLPERKWISFGGEGELKQRTSTIMKNFARVGAIEFETAPPWERKERKGRYVYELSSDIKKIGGIPKRELEEIKNIPLTGKYNYETKKRIEELLKKYKVSPEARNIIKSPVALLVAWSLARGATQYKEIAKRAGISEMMTRGHMNTFLKKGLVVRRPYGIRIRFESPYAIRILNYLRAMESIIVEHLKEEGVKPPKPKEEREKKTTPKKVEMPVFSIEKIPTMEEAIRDLEKRGYISDAEERAKKSIELLRKLHKELGEENPDPSRVRQLVVEWGVWYGIPSCKDIAKCIPKPFSIRFGAVSKRISKAGKRDPKLLEKWEENQYHNPNSVIYRDVEGLTKDRTLPEKVKALYEMCRRAEEGEKINIGEVSIKTGLDRKTVRDILTEGVDEYIAKRPRGKIAFMVQLANEMVPSPLEEEIEKIIEDANKRPLVMRQAVIEKEIERLVVKYAEEKGISMEEAYERIMKLFEEYT